MMGAYQSSVASRQSGAVVKGRDRPAGLFERPQRLGVEGVHDRLACRDPQRQRDGLPWGER